MQPVVAAEAIAATAKGTSLKQEIESLTERIHRLVTGAAAKVSAS